MAKSKKGTASTKEIKKLEEEIKYDVEIVENLQKKSILSQDDLDLIKLFNQKIQEKTQKLQALKGITDELRDSSDDYESVLRSIGNKYGEINSIYKESEKILALNKEEISGILSITGLLNSSNAKLIDGILESQKAYKGITTSIVENIGGLEDSETSYKKINFEIQKQEKLIGSLQDELKNIDKSDEKQVIAAEELNKQLKEQTVSLGKMKDAAGEVKRTFDGIDTLGKEISGTMFGGWIDKFLNLTKIAGITDFGSVSEMLNKFKEPVAKDSIASISEKDKVLQNIKENQQSQVPPPTQPEAVQQTTTAEQSQVPPPTQPEAVQQTGEKTPQPSIVNISADVVNISSKGLGKEQTKISKPTETEQTQIPQPNTELPPTIDVSTQKLEEEQTKYAEKSADSTSSLSTTALKDERRKNRAKRVGFGKYFSKEKGKKTDLPGVEKIAEEIKSNNSIQIESTKNTEKAITANQQQSADALDSMKSEFKEAEIQRANAAEKEKIEHTTTDVSGKLQSDSIGSLKDGSFGRAGRFAAKAGIVAGVIGLAKEVLTFQDTVAAAVLKYSGIIVGGTETMKKFAEEVQSGKGLDALGFQKSIEDTEEYRKLQFQYTTKANLKERQNLETDYFNYQKQVFFDYYEYENEVVRQNVDYELGLRKDALQFQFQQQSANLDAELEKRKTLAGSAMKFIGNYSKIAERALNAIGSSTKTIMDGMKQFGAVLGGTAKSQFELVENAQGLAYEYGASQDQILNISHMFKLLGKTTEKAGMGLVTGLKDLVGVKNVQSVFNEIAEASADIYRLMAATPDQIGKQTEALRKAGTKLSTMLKASDTMVLNYKDSIKAEMSLGAMIGRSVNFTQARAALMSGDMVGAANAIRQSLGGIDVNQLNPFAKQELARATGLTMDQIIQIQQGGKIETDEEKQLKVAKLTGKAIADATLNQDIANAGARLALEQSQRKQMLEMEQAQRLVTLRLEQKQRLEQIPVESAYRFYWDKIYAFKFAKEDFTMDALGDFLTNLVNKGNEVTGGAAEYLKQLEKQQLGPNANVMQNLQTLGINYQTTKAGQINIPSVQTGVGAAANLTPQIRSLGNTIVALDNKVEDMNISSRDIRYQQWLLGSHDISQKYKGGKSPELAEKEYNDLFNKLFSGEIQLEKNKELNVALESINTLESKIDINKIQDRDTYFEIIRKFSDNQKIDKGFFGGDYATIDGKEFALNVLKGSEKDIELRNVIQKKLDQQRQLQINQVDILKQQLQQGKITQDTFNSKINELKNSMNINLNIQQPTTKPTTLPTMFVDNSEELKKAAELNPSYFKDGKPRPGSPFPAPTKYNPFPFNYNPFASPVGGQLGGISGGTITTTPTENTEGQMSVPSPTTPQQQEGIPTPNQITVDMENTNAILSRIQSEADQRGITMYTKQIDQNGNLQRIVTRTQNTAAAVEASKPDIKRVADVGVASTQNLEQIQIEMIKELQTANELLVGVLNNTAPADKGMIINLDGSKIAQNFIGRMNNRRSFNGSNTVKSNI